MSELELLINKMIQGALPGINQGLGKLIINNGLDPLGNVASGTEDAGSIDLGIGTASASAHYSITSLRGLSSILINKIDLSNITGSINSFTADVSVSFVMSSIISANVSGSVKAGIGFIQFSPGLSGNVKAEGVSGGGTGILKGIGAIEEGKVTLQSVDLINVGINYRDASASIDGLGPLNSLLDPVASLITNVLKSYITDDLKGVIQNVINEEIRNFLPYSIDIM